MWIYKKPKSKDDMALDMTIREAVMREKCSFFEHCSNGGGVKPMLKNYVVNFV